MFSKINNSIYILVALSFIAFGCNEEGWPYCIKGKGSVKTTYISCSPINSIDLKLDNASLLLMSGAGQQIQLMAQENISEQLTTSCDGDLWNINTSRCIRKSEPVNIVISLNQWVRIANSSTGNIALKEIKQPKPLQIENNGTGSFTCADTINVPILTIASTGTGNIQVVCDVDTVFCMLGGSGNIILSGFANRLNIIHTGSATIFAYDLNVSRCNVLGTGSGNSKVKVSSTIDATLSGSGNVFIKGSPIISFTASGSGSVVNDN